MEFLNCQAQDFHDIILSMKASDANLWYKAYRMLVYENDMRRNNVRENRW